MHIVSSTYKAPCFQIVQKSSEYLGYFYEKIGTQDLLKIAQSDHNDVHVTLFCA